MFDGRISGSAHLNGDLWQAIAVPFERQVLKDQIGRSAKSWRVRRERGYQRITGLVFHPFV